jgi:hypothetical protein
MMMNRWKSLTLAGGLAALVTSLAAPATATAAANPTAYNTRYKQYLTTETNDSLPASCVSRRIYLADGLYNWGQLFGGQSLILRPNMYLGSDWYTWTDCLDPENQLRPFVGRYTHSTTLNPDNPDWETAGLYNRWGVSAPSFFTWGSFLAPQ